nr:MAG TPA: co-chaperone HscB [Caudoviricetes sp.]DAY70524.1 MAG TPA: co-chaperone HscB [Caudoviricetes sp.]
MLSSRELGEGKCAEVYGSLRWDSAASCAASSRISCWSCAGRDSNSARM